MPPLIVNHHPRIHQRGIRIRLEHLRQRLPAVGRVAQTIMRDDFRAQAAFVQISFRSRIEFQLLRVKISCHRRRFFQRLLFFLALGTDFGIIVLPAHFRHNHTYAVGKELNRLRKRQSLMFHHKTNRRTMRPATETMIKLLGRTDRKRRCFFLVERATRHIVRPAFFQRNLLVDDADNIGFGQKLVNEVGWNHDVGGRDVCFRYGRYEIGIFRNGGRMWRFRQNAV